MSFKYDSDSYTNAAQAGDLETIKNAHLSGCPWDKWVIRYAASNGHLDCLQYAYENGCPWDEHTTYYAASYGRLDCLRYAHENGCPWWDEEITLVAAKNGHLDCLRYLHENGCPLDEKTAYYAARNGHGHFQCFKYCFQTWNDDPQTFWNTEYDLIKIIHQIDLDDPVWRRLFTINLSKNPRLQDKVEMKKKEIETLKMLSIELLENKIPKDVLKYCLYSYF